jgi:hypothetical protein
MDTKSRHPLFREIPPVSVVWEVLKLLNLSTEPPFTFTKDLLLIENSDEAAALLEPYYMPCKARQFLDHTDQLRWITVLRHILLPNGYVIQKQETTRNKKKTILYTIDRISVIEGPLRHAVNMEFT